jgi:N-acetylglucosaminyl-diphospho-decaprenol L-rhamnosyltransferase
MSGRRSVVAIVVTFDSADVVTGCLDSLAATAPETPVIVVDNGSRDGTVELVRRHAPWARLVESPRNGGYAAGINLGAAHSPDATALLVLNPDVRVAPDAVDALLVALAAPGTGVAVPRIVEPDGQLARSLRRTPTVLRAFGEAVLGGVRAGRVAALSEIVAVDAAYEHSHVVDWASGAVMMIDRRCHDELGGWDESLFLYAEETDFCLRARDRGWVTRFVPTATATHIGGHGERTPWRELMLVNRAVVFRRRHGPWRSLAYRGGLGLHEALRCWRGPHHRAALRRLIGFGSRLGPLPPVSP